MQEGEFDEGVGMFEKDAQRWVSEQVRWRMMEIDNIKTQNKLNIYGWKVRLKQIEENILVLKELHKKYSIMLKDLIKEGDDNPEVEE